MNTLREIKCLVLCKDNDMLDTYRTSPYQNIKYTKKMKVTSAGDGVVKFISEFLQSNQTSKVGNQQVTQSA